MHLTSLLEEFLMIELQHFVQRALLDIVGGVQGAQEAVQAPCSVISPIDNDYQPRLEPVTFEIEVTVAERSGAQDGFGIFVDALGGANQTQGATRLSSGWVRFKVHVRMPVQKQDRVIAEKYRHQFERLALEASKLGLVAPIMGSLVAWLAR
jgi:hypothetical protein